MHKLPGINSLSIRMLAFFGGLLLVATCSYAAVESVDAKQYGGEYRVPLDGEPLSLDPASLTDIYAINVASNLFDGLVEFDKNMHVVPSIATVWKISRDHRTYVFQLRKGVKFHNGREVTAEDFVYSFSRILSSEIGSSAASMFQKIRGAKAFCEGNSKTVSGLSAPDTYTLKIELEEPFAPFLSILAMIHAKVVPREAMGSDFGRQPVGTGPFRFRAWEPGRKIILEANKDHFAGRPFLDILSFLIYPNTEWEKVFSRFVTGELEQAMLPSGKYNMIASDKELRDRFTIISKPGLNLVYIGLNMGLDIFKESRVRQAIYYAVDREKITREITMRNSRPANGILPPGIAGFDPDNKGYPYDLQMALKLLAEAGYPGGQGLPPIEIWTVSKSESVKKELQAYQNFLGEIGIQLSIKVAENWKEFIKRIKEKKADMFYFAWYADFPDPDNFLYPLCHSRSRTNRTGYSNPEIDRMLEKARVELDYMKRVEQYRKIEKLVMRDTPFICQHINCFNYVFQPWVKGVNMSHLGANYLSFRNVWIDHQQFASNLPICNPELQSVGSNGESL